MCECVPVPGNLHTFSNPNFADECACDLLTRRVVTFQQLLTYQRRKLAHGGWGYLRRTTLDLLPQHLERFVEPVDFCPALFDADSDVGVTSGKRAQLDAIVQIGQATA